MRRVVALVALLALLGGAAGCSSPRKDHSPLPAITHTATPSGPGESLRDLGFTNGPTNVSLPEGTVLEPSVDQPNVVTAFFTEPAPAVALPHLRNSLRQAGFTIAADAGGSLVFEGPEWTGSYTATGDLNAITFRRR